MNSKFNLSEYLRKDVIKKAAKVKEKFKEKGILFGASVTMTTENVRVVTSKAFCDRLYKNSPLFIKLNETGMLLGEHDGGCHLFEKKKEVKKMINN